MTRLTLSMCLVLAFVAVTGCADSEPKRPAVQVPELPLSPDTDEPVRAQFSERHAHLLAALDRPDADPVDIGWSLGQLGRVFHAYHFLEEAITCYEQAHELDPLAFEWPYLLGQLQRVLGRTELATRSLEAASMLRPQEPVPYAALGEIALEADQLEKARRYFGLALEAAPQNALSLYGLAKVDIAAGRVPDATERLRALLKLQPRAYQLLYAMGDALKRQGRTQEAGAYLAQIPDAANRIGLKSADRWMEAVQDLAVSATALERKARKALVAGQYRNAQNLLQQAADIAPDRVEISYNLALAQFRAGSHDDAAQTLSRLITRFPNFGPAYRLKGQMAQQRGAPTDATRWFELASEKNPRNASSQLALADHWLALEKYDAAIQKYSDTISLDQRSVDAHIGLSIARFSVGMRAEAKSGLQTALNLMPYARRLNWWVKRWSLAEGEATGASELGVPRGAFEIETLAMGLAAGGDFSSAARWQERAIRIVGHNHAHRAAMQRRLIRYQNNQQVKAFWEDSDVALKIRPRESGQSAASDAQIGPNATNSQQPTTP